MIDTITPISKVKKGDIEIPIVSAGIEEANDFTLLLTGNYNYMTEDICEKIINGNYIV